MVNWFRRGLPPHQTDLAMIGAKAGDVVVFLGADAPDVIAEVARVTGLNGRTIAVDDRAGARERVEHAAAAAGALVECIEAPPGSPSIDAGSVRIAVIAASEPGSADAMAGAIASAFRLLEPGGRVIVRVPAARGGIFGRSASAPPDLVPALERAGGIAARLLATAEGFSYFESRRR